MDELRAKISKLREKIKFLSKENQILKNKNIALSRENERLKSEKHALIDDLKKLNQKNKDLESFKIKYNKLLKERNKPFSERKEDNINDTNLEQILQSQLGQWKEVLERIRHLDNRFNKLNKKINSSLLPARRIISKLSPSDIRVGLFVDVQNIFYGARQFNAKLNFDYLLKKAVGNRRLIRAIAYVVLSSEVDQSGFLTMLQHKSYEVKSKALRLRMDGSAKANWDIEMTIDILSYLDKFDVVVLVTGDGDFVPLVNILKTLGPIVEVYSFPQNTSKDLIESADKYIPIDESFLILNEYQPLKNKR